MRDFDGMSGNWIMPPDMESLRRNAKVWFEGEIASTWVMGNSRQQVGARVTVGCKSFIVMIRKTRSMLFMRGRSPIGRNDASAGEEDDQKSGQTDHRARF